MVSETYQTIKKIVDNVELIDSHEHLMPEKDRLAVDSDPLSIFLKLYTASDLVSSGMQQDELRFVRDTHTPLAERWKVFAPYWENVRHTGYGRVLEIVAKDIYGVDGIREETYLELSRRMRQASTRGLYRRILREKARIERCILDPLDELTRPIATLDVDTDLFVPVQQFREFMMVNNIFDLRRLAKKVGIPIHSLPDLVAALEVEFERVAPAICGIKTSIAYYRTTRFENTEQAEAERAFNCIFKEQPLDWEPNSIIGSVLLYGPSMEEAKPLQDYMMHKIIRLAAKHHLPIQVHTGLQDGFGNILSNANPLNLTNLFVQYPEVNFDLFHGGYPYIGEVATLAKNFQNVYVDLCWLHIISPTRTKEALSEYLDTVPSNKILAFGGDYVFVEGVYGHSVIARENVTRVLSDRVEDGIMSVEDAEKVAKRILRENALNLFHLSHRK
jgi:hypothetical protein